MEKKLIWIPTDKALPGIMHQYGGLRMGERVIVYNENIPFIGIMHRRIYANGDDMFHSAENTFPVKDASYWAVIPFPD